MMKRTFAILMCLAILAAPAALAVTMDEAQTAAQAVAGADAVLRESDRDDGNYEFEFQDESKHYEVHVNGESGAVYKAETALLGAKKASGAALDEAAARAAAAEALPGATLHYALLEEDDGRFEWKVFYSEGTSLGICSIQAETGEAYATEVFYDLPEGTLTADRAVDALIAAKGALTLRELDLDLEERSGKYYYEGKAELNGTVYEFEISAATGDIVEWERD